MKKSGLLIGIISVFLLGSCTDLLLEKDPSRDPESCFEILWSEFDKFYGEFAIKKINWDSLYDEYRPQVNHTTTPDELFTVFTGLLDNLNDSHVILAGPTVSAPVYHSGILKNRAKDDFYLETIRNHYLQSFRTRSSFTYGKLTATIGYIYIADFEDDQQTYQKAMHAIMQELRDVTSWVVDIRNNDGGNDAAAQVVAGYFASSKAHYMTIRRKNGPSHDSFDPPKKWYVTPQTAHPVSGSIVMLTNRWTISTGETFAMAMKVNPQVIQVGDTTTGAFSDTRDFVLPNGFWTRIPTSEVKFADGKSYEGIGLAPDVYVRATKEELLAGTDKVLEKAIELIQ